MTVLRKIGLYWHTLKYLRLTQFTGRLMFRIARPIPDLAPPPALRDVKNNWAQPAHRTASMSGPETFLFLGEIGSLEDNGWDSAARSKLWRYNQHYFDDLNAFDADQRREWHASLISRWIDENPPGQGSGWEPYPTSLRIVNWVKYAQSGEDLSNKALHSLAIQTRWLTQRLEWHLLGNHLFANAKALIHAGLFFGGSEADNWRQKGVDILERELVEQFLPDGGQFELTPMYHALALEDILDLINLMTAYADGLNIREKRLLSDCRQLVSRMRHWLAAMSHPDGQISFFNDAAFGIAPETSDLARFAEELDLAINPLTDGLTYLPDSGYVRMERDQAVLIADIAKIGPDYLPGHAHADTLSFELSLFGQRVFVNSGTSEYGIGPERLRQRSTAAHNTVVVQDRNSSEVWSGFRVARRAHVHDVLLEDHKGILSASARHDGYRRFDRGLDHSRKWSLGGQSLSIIDRLTTKRPAVAYFHLHPDIRVEMTGESNGLLHLPNGHTVHLHAQKGSVTPHTSTWHPQFGVLQPNTCICLSFDDVGAELELTWKC